jgi:hypothetical protein
MRAHDNPYTPNAGARPPALVGRDAELVAFDVMLEHRPRPFACPLGVPGSDLRVTDPQQRDDVSLMPTSA